MNDLDVETRLREQLPRLAEHATVVDDPNPSLAAVRTDPVHTRRRGTRVAAVVAAAALVVAGLVVADAVRSSDDPRPAPAAGEPTGPAIHSLTIVVSNFRFEAMHYDVPAGITELRLVSAEGTHQLRFDQPQFDYVRLWAPGGGPDRVKVDLVEGHTYGIFDPLPGHQQAGEVATISVGPPGTPVHMVATTSTTTLPPRP